MPSPIRRSMLGESERVDLASAIKMRGKSAMTEFAELSVGRLFPADPSMRPSAPIKSLETG